MEQTRALHAPLKRSSSLMARVIPKRPNWAGWFELHRTGADLTRWKYRVNLKSRREGRNKEFRSSKSVCFLRTQQRAKSQCIKYVQTPVGASLRILPHGIYVSHESLMVGFLVSGLPFGVAWLQSFNGEFDPGSGRTLAACLTHASRTGHFGA
jgi:hypothetical protein